MKTLLTFVQFIIWYLVVYFSAKHGASYWPIFLFGFAAYGIDDAIRLWIDKKRGDI